MLVFVWLYVFEYNGDCYGWVEGEGGCWYFILYIEVGWLVDVGVVCLLFGLCELVKVYIGSFCMICN